MPKRTQQPKKLKRMRKLGFMSRNSSHSGINVLKRRRNKGRANLTVSDDYRASKKKMISRSK